MTANTEWMGRRWFEMRIGYGTYMAFMFGFANFILLLHGLTDTFKDYPLHWFAVAMIAVIVPGSIIVGHRHNRTQQKTESRNLTHLHPYNNTLIPDSKEVFYETYVHTMLDLMIATARRPGLGAELGQLRAALDRYMDGETATGALDREGVRLSGSGGREAAEAAMGRGPRAGDRP